MLNGWALVCKTNVVSSILTPFSYFIHFNIEINFFIEACLYEATRIISILLPRKDMLYKGVTQP